MRLYRSPLGYRPPLAYGGHNWRLRGVSALCTRCHSTVPVWSLGEGLWPTLVARWCPGLIRALPAAGSQLDIWHAMGTTT